MADLDLFNSTAEAVYRDVIGLAGAEGIQRPEAFATAQDALRGMVDRGELVLDADSAIRAALHAADKRQGQAADIIIRRFARGEDTLDIEGDPTLETVVILGEGLRKAWQHVTMADLSRMDSLRYKAYRDQADAYDRWRQDYERVMPAVMRFGTIGAAVAAHAFDVDGLSDAA